MLPEGIKKSLEKKVTVVSEQQWYSSNEERPPSKYYIIDCFGDYCFIHTRERAKAQSIADQIWGVGFYKVKQIMTAQVR